MLDLKIGDAVGTPRWGVIVARDLTPPEQRGKFWRVKCDRCGVINSCSTSRINANSVRCRSTTCETQYVRKGRPSQVVLTALDYQLNMEVSDSPKGWVDRLTALDMPGFKAPSEQGIRDRQTKRRAGHPRIQTDHDVIYGLRFSPYLHNKPPPAKLQREQRKARAGDALRAILDRAYTDAMADISKIMSAVPQIDVHDLPFKDYETGEGPVYMLVEEFGMALALKKFWADLCRRFGLGDKMSPEEEAKFIAEMYGDEN